MNDLRKKRCTREDLDRLTECDRTEVFAVLRSFDDAGLGEEEFILRTAGPLDESKVPGLAEAVAARDGDAAAQAVYAACGGGEAPVEPAEADADTIARAEEILDNTFTFYDETCRLPDDIDWEHNPGTRHWGCDLNRFSFLGPLTAAWRATGDERFARKAVELITDWVAKSDAGKCFTGTPYMFGSYLNNAIHCRAWTACLESLLPHGQVRPRELMRILKSVHDQLAWLEIVTNGHAGNWPTIGCMGMLRTLAALPVFRDTDRWVDYCIETLAAQIDDQVLPDGVQDELTPHYHCVVINNLISALESLDRLGRELPDRTLDTLRKMVHYARQTITPDGSARVAFNDSDPMARSDLHEGLRRSLEKVGRASMLTPTDRLGPEPFEYAGVALLRQRPDEGDLYLAFDGGPFGRGHQHEDKLGFWLFAYGRNLLIDPGRHLYDWSERSFLPYLRSTRAHSTITIDGADQCSRNRPDKWIPREPAPMTWSESDGEIRAAAAYELGYGEGNEIAVVHRREIVFVAGRFWLVFDRVEGASRHLVESRFQFAPGEVTLDGPRAVTTFDDANLLLEAVCRPGFDDAEVAAGQRNPDLGWFSPGYGHVEPSPTLTFRARTELPLLIAALLYPFAGRDVPDVSIALDGACATVHVGTDEEHVVRCGL